jgi:hypothetical protein
MEGGIAILLILIVGVIGGGLFMMFGGGMEALRHRRGGDLAHSEGGDDDRPRHRLAEPTDEQAVGYGVGGEHAADPQPARVEHPPPGTER